mgnify:FL=1
MKKNQNLNFNVEYFKNDNFSVVEYIQKNKNKFYTPKNIQKLRVTFDINPKISLRTNKVIKEIKFLNLPILVNNYFFVMITNDYIKIFENKKDKTPIIGIYNSRLTNNLAIINVINGSKEKQLFINLNDFKLVKEFKINKIDINLLSILLKIDDNNNITRSYIYFGKISKIIIEL